MSDVVRSAAYAAFQSLGQAGLPAKRSHLGEVLAALLGYGTFSALSVEEFSQKEGCTDHAEILVVEHRAGVQRIRSLRQDLDPIEHARVIAACVQGLTDCAVSTTVFADLDEFYDSWAKNKIAEAIFDSDHVASSGLPLRRPELPSTTPATSNLWQSRFEWCIEVRGIVCELEDDEISSEHHTRYPVVGRLTFRKAGRAGLVVLDRGGAFCTVDGSVTGMPTPIPRLGTTA